MIEKVLQRFIDIWKLDFLAKFFAGEKNDKKTTVLFWFLSNAVVTMILTIAFGIFLFDLHDIIIDGIGEHVPDNARITITDGQLTTENFDDPLFRDINANNTEYGYDESFAMIIDSRATAYDITSLDEYSGGFIMTSDRAYFKDGAELNQIIFAEVPNFSISKEEIITFIDEYFIFPFSITLVIVVGIFMFVWLSGLRLISAFWWAFMLFILMRIFDVKDEYMTAYNAVLNLYFIPTLVVFVVGLVMVSIPLLMTMIFIAIFIVNLLWLKKSMKKDITENKLKNLVQTTKNNVVEQSEKK